MRGRGVESAEGTLFCGLPDCCGDADVDSSAADGIERLSEVHRLRRG